MASRRALTRTANLSLVGESELARVTLVARTKLSKAKKEKVGSAWGEVLPTFFHSDMSYFKWPSGAALA